MWTDEEKRQHLINGDPLHFPPWPAEGKESQEDTEARTIKAEWLAALAPKPGRVVNVPIDLANALIAGPLNLQYATFEAELSITDCRFTDEADFSFASFKRSATVQGSRFAQPANFRAAHAHADFRMMGASLADASTFQDLHVNELLQASGATFGSVNFERIEVTKGAFFRTADKGQRTTFAGEARFHSAHIQGNAEFSGAEFKGKASFDGLQVDGDAFFRTDDKGQRTTFGSEARFLGAHIKGSASFSGAEFKGPASFDGLQVDGPAFFRTDDEGQCTTFGSEARFHSAHIMDVADFRGSDFKGRATFDSLQVDGSAFFSTDDNGQRTTFGEARFHSAHIKGVADYSGAQFKGKADFDRMQVDGSAFFRIDDHGNCVTFGGEANFIGAHIMGNAEFDGAQFKGKASFENFQVDRDAYFRPGSDGNSVQFDGIASFPSAVFGIDAQFTATKFKGASVFNNAHFRGAAEFGRTEFSERQHTSLIGARFERGVSFVSSSFKGTTDFTAAIADRDAYFHGATFSKDTSFREARFAVVHFEVPDRKPSDPSLPTTFLGGVDLRGFRYDRMGVAWRTLLDKLTPYDRQPYGQLEKTFREAGEDRKADEVYLQRRRVERKDKWKHRQYGAWFGDSVYGVLANYGVRPYRLLLFTTLVLGFGLIIFSSPHAVTHKDLRLRADDPLSLGWRQATAVSVNLFLPVEVAAGSQWVPTENRIPLFGRLAISFTTYASVHRLAGWLLVPLGVAALTGLLHKPGKTDRG